MMKGGVESLQLVKVSKRYPLNITFFISSFIHLDIICPPLPAPENGQVVFSNASSLIYGSEATYSCDEGFGLNEGDATRTCGGNSSSVIGFWSGSEPACEGSHSCL